MCALISVGIHENLVLTDDTKINEYGTLELGIKTLDDPKALVNAFENNTALKEMKSSFRFYPPSEKDHKQKVKKAEQIAEDFLKMRYQFTQYALLFGTKEEVNAAIGGKQMFVGTGQEDTAKAIAQLKQESYRKKVNQNLAEKFVKFLKSKKAFDGTKPFRQKFLRQSEAKNFATIPTSDFDTWIEPMDVPKKASKIAYSKWEIDNKKHLSEPIATTSPDTKKADVKKASKLFAGKGSDSAPKMD